MVEFCNRAAPGFFMSDVSVAMWDSIITALCLVFILEGMVPFLYPSRWRQLVITLAATSDRKLRIMGLASMLVGLCCLLIAT